MVLWRILIQLNASEIQHSPVWCFRLCITLYHNGFAFLEKCIPGGWFAGFIQSTRCLLNQKLPVDYLQLRAFTETSSNISSLKKATSHPKHCNIQTWIFRSFLDDFKFRSLTDPILPVRCFLWHTDIFNCHTKWLDGQPPSCLTFGSFLPCRHDV